MIMFVVSKLESLVKVKKRDEGCLMARKLPADRTSICA